MNNLIELFATDRYLLEHKGSLIIRQLSLFISPERMYLLLAKILENQEVILKNHEIYSFSYDLIFFN